LPKANLTSPNKQRPLRVWWFRMPAYTATVKRRRAAPRVETAKPKRSRSKARRLSVRLIAASDEVLWLLAGARNGARAAIRQRQRP